MDIALSLNAHPSDVATLLSTSFPSLRVRVDQLDDLVAPTETERPEIHCVLVSGTDAYPLGIDVYAFPGFSDERVYVALARLLSTGLSCDAVCDGTTYGLTDEATGTVGSYWSLLWRQGRGWLADDSPMDPHDGPAGPVRLIHPLYQLLPAFNLDGSIDER